MFGFNKKNGSAKDKKKKKAADDIPKSLPREIVEILLFGLAILLFFKNYVWQNFQIPTSSMENTLLIGDHITANTMVFKSRNSLEKKLFPFRDVTRGDVVVFKYPGNVTQDWIKRCIGVPGDHFRMKNNFVFINDRPLDEVYTYYKPPKTPGVSNRDKTLAYRPSDYYTLKPGIDHASYLKSGQDYKLSQLKNKTRQKLRQHFRRISPHHYDRVIQRLASGDAEVIPPGFYLMMGDNRNNSQDSRFWGLVPEELIHGRAYFVWWSYGEDEGSHEKRGFDLIWSYLRVPYTIFTRTHWPETFTLIK